MKYKSPILWFIFGSILGVILSHLRNHLDALGDALGPKNLKQLTVVLRICVSEGFRFLEFFIPMLVHFYPCVDPKLQLTTFPVGPLGDPREPNN